MNIPEEIQKLEDCILAVQILAVQTHANADLLIMSAVITGLRSQIKVLKYLDKNVDNIIVDEEATRVAKMIERKTI